MTDVMKGIRILEVAEHTFVPAASAVLADWGADVVKVEHAGAGRRDARSRPHRRDEALRRACTCSNEHSNRGKRSIGIDLAHPEGLEVLYALARSSDVFLTNKLPGNARQAAHRRRRHPRRQPEDHLRARERPSACAGPISDRGGYDMTAFWCRAGNAASVTPAELPGVLPQPGPAWGDSMGGMTIAGGIAAALLKRERTGEPSVVDVSLLSAGMWALSATHRALPADRSARGRRRCPEARPRATRWWARTKPATAVISLVMLQGFHYWPDFCEHIERPDLARDPRFDGVEKLAANASAAAAILRGDPEDPDDGRVDETLPDAEAGSGPRCRTRSRWSTTRRCARTATSPGRRRSEGDGVRARDDPRPVRRAAARRPARAPEFNEHGDEILQELGMDMERIIALRASGAVA